MLMHKDEIKERLDVINGRIKDAQSILLLLKENSNEQTTISPSDSKESSTTR